MRVMATACAIAVVLSAGACGGNGGDEQGADDEVLQALTSGTIDDEQAKQAQQAGQVVLAAGLLAGNAVSCREGTLGRDKCRRELGSNTKDLLDGLEGFDDDSFKRTTIDDALETVKGLCEECEEMLRDERP